MLCRVDSMRCPQCELPLITFEAQGVELDYCAADMGLWFDEGEIEALFASPVPVLQPSEAGPKSKKRCPRCGVRMRSCRPAPGLTIEVCPLGDGVWLDRGDLGRLSTALQESATDPTHVLDVVAKLGSVLGQTALGEETTSSENTTGSGETTGSEEL